MSPGEIFGVTPRSFQVQKPFVFQPFQHCAIHGLRPGCVTLHCSDDPPFSCLLSLAGQELVWVITVPECPHWAQALRPSGCFHLYGVRRGAQALAVARDLELARLRTELVWTSGPVAASHSLWIFPCIEQKAAKWPSVLEAEAKQAIGEGCYLWWGWMGPQHVGLKSCPSSESHFRLTKGLTWGEGGENQAPRAGLKWDL